MAGYLLLLNLSCILYCQRIYVGLGVNFCCNSECAELVLLSVFVYFCMVNTNNYMLSLTAKCIDDAALTKKFAEGLNTKEISVAVGSDLGIYRR